MLPKTRFGRRMLCATGAFAFAAALTAALRWCTPDYRPHAPDYRSRGPAGAKVELVVFSDFECGGCRASEEPLKQLNDMFPGKIRLMFKHMPWDFHPHAKAAAAAAECAGRQGRFWEYHDLLFKKQPQWVDSKKPLPDFLLFALELRLDSEEFQRCSADPAAAAAVASDAKEAKEHWVRATPSFFINGRRFVGVRQLRGPGFNFIERTLKK